ncbi:MAG TPA: thioredoxin domain-containing protein [Acidimicrobiales bacterium]|nr:thioredoxin domain-containing protein [Acidimicrobiales bacterium]
MNRLAEETSPYLRQHADNPVDWFPWGDEAFAKARDQDRPIFLSVGYSACHWCHVMAHESFEDAAVAAALNTGFVPVKVDREERPDVDAVYMEAVQALTGRGGWPMSVFMTPDGRPFFGGTYFPPHDVHGLPGFGRLLEAVGEAWTERRAEVERQADALADAVTRRSTLPEVAVGLPAASPGGAARLAGAIDSLAQRFDEVYGGFGPAPKFPQPVLVELCLRHHRASGDPRSLAMAETTLAAMASGGIYDHLGGGFCRYSTDDTWTVPHFEKMLYDQAGLVRCYLHAWQLTGRHHWLEVVEETIGYVLRDLGTDTGGFCSSEDADSEGEEGSFYLWTRQQFDDVLGEESKVASSWYGLDGDPNFGDRHILRRPPGTAIGRPPAVTRARARLVEARAIRERPGLDDKVLTEWNAMFGSTLAEAAGATGRREWVDAARSLAGFLLGQLRGPGGRWLRSWQGGRARHLAYAADYAWLVDCFTRVGELTGEAQWLGHAAEVAEDMVRLFRQGDGPLFVTGADAEALVVRPLDALDGATPSATSVGGTAMVRLGALLGDRAVGDAGRSLLASVAAVADEHPLAAANAVAGDDMVAGGMLEVVVTGSRPDLVRAVQARYEPALVLAWGERQQTPLWEGRSDDLAYVCRDYRCSAPAATVEELVDRLEDEGRRPPVRLDEVAPA